MTPVKTDFEGPIGPNQRPDAAPVHSNIIRAFREELRLSRDEFCSLIDANPATERGWEAGLVSPNSKAAIQIADLARKNYYPLTLEAILTVTQQPDKKKKRRKK